MRLYRLLSFKLFLLVFFVLTILSVGFSLYYIRIESQQYQVLLRQCAQRSAAIVAASTRNAMLANHKEDTYAIIDAIARQKAISKIYLMDKTGKIVYSTIPAEIGIQLKPKDRDCQTCHKGDGINRTAENMDVNLFNIQQTSSGSRELHYIEPIVNETSCYTAACHAHHENQAYLGILTMTMPLKVLDEEVAENRQKLVTTSIAITLVLGLVVGGSLWFFVHIPVQRLIQGTREVSAGNLDYTITYPVKDEIGILAGSFNLMTRDLKQAKEEITTWSNQLEERVKQKTDELERTQQRNLQIEKMASLGQLSATVAHELNNPMAGILTYSKLIQKKIQKDTLTPEEKQQVIKYLKMIEGESQRSGEIVKNMLLFSRQEAVDKQPRNLNQIIEGSVELIQHHLKLNNIELKMNLQSDLPQVKLDENQIKQALLALYVNAVEAMEDSGILTVRSQWRKADRVVSIYISDNGHGIPEKVREQIFEPFFTTKNAVKGVGLGLSAVYAIVQKHNGDIAFESEIDKGTTFRIDFPLEPPPEKS